MALRLHSHALHGFKQEWLQCTKTHNCTLSSKPNRVHQNTRPQSFCVMSMTAGQSGDPGKINLDRVMDKARKLWESSPQQVKTFPWNRALENFIQLILDLFLAVIKYLCVPVFAVSSLSEMSYCAHERKLFLIPIPLLVGAAVAGVLRETALQLSPLLKRNQVLTVSPELNVNLIPTLPLVERVVGPTKSDTSPTRKFKDPIVSTNQEDAEVPWHLIAIAIVFTLLKLPGPSYPYWGRIFIPHFANGGLLSTLYFAFLWYRRPQKASEALPSQSS